VTARRLVVTADDFGAAPEVNVAVVRAHRDGILTSASLMVTGDAVEEAAQLARETPTLAVGLHLVLAQGRAAAPRAEIPDLVAEDGAFRREPVSTGIRYAWQCLSGAGRAQLRREIEAQLAAFAATGLRLAHLDGHLNMHLHPMVLPILLELAPRYGIRAMRLLREDLGAALRYDRATSRASSGRASSSAPSPPTRRRVSARPASRPPTASTACTRPGTSTSATCLR